MFVDFKKMFVRKATKSSKNLNEVRCFFSLMKIKVKVLLNGLKVY